MQTYSIIHFEKMANLFLRNCKLQPFYWTFFSFVWISWVV